MRKIVSCLWACWMVSAFALCAAEPTAVVQDFEQKFEVNKWPPDKPGEISFSTEWKADGAQSLKVDPGLMAALSNLKLKNWSGYTNLRIRIRNTSTRAAAVGFELQDQHGSFHERHQNGFGVAPGEHTIDMDISGGLWRGEENKPYRGKIKTPINLDRITRLSFTNNGDAAIFIDQIEVVKVQPIATSGGFAFDFGRRGTQVMSQFKPVFDNTNYQDATGFGLVGGRPSMLGKAMSYPTPLLGDGLGFDGGGFKVKLPGGAYKGWIAFERGGFWEDEASGYRRATLTVNDATVHEHDFTPAGQHFFFQDTEVTDMSQLADKIIWPAHAVATFTFKAAEGENHFKLSTTEHKAYPLRVAGLILAPDTEEGNAFLKAHEDHQRKTIARTYADQDRGRRGEGRAVPAQGLICEPLPPGADVYPRDWPARPEGAAPGTILAVQGQRVTLQLGVYAKRDAQVTVEAGALSQGGGTLAAPLVSYGRYLPMRPYGVGAVWLEISHYRPEKVFTVGPNITRSLLAEYVVPADAAPGLYKGLITLNSEAGKVDVPVSIQVVTTRLEDIPIPVGVFMNALPVPPDYLDEETWWQLQEDLLREQMGAGLTAVSGGPGLRIAPKKVGEKVVFEGDSALKYLELARKHGTLHAIVPYGGFVSNVKSVRLDPKAFAEGWKAFEAEHKLPPCYFYAYDEPGTAEEKSHVLRYLAGFTAAGLRTIGYTSWHGGDELWEKIAKNSYAPAMNIHTGKNLKTVKSWGQHPWVYNNGLDRVGMGLRVWRSMQFGCEGRMQWIGLFTQGFAFHNLDGREPSKGCFLVHAKLGALKTPAWLSVREGLLDLRIRLTLEKYAPADDPALKLWTTDGYKKDEADWTDAKLDEVRAKMLQRLSELKK